MSDQRSPVMSAICVAVASLVLNGFLFVYFYNHLATPFITEEQRVSNADTIMTAVLGSFVGAAIIVGVVGYLLNNR